MSQHFNSRVFRNIALAAGLVLCQFAGSLGIEQAAAVTVTHRYDFEPVSGPRPTEVGWTHMDRTIMATPTSAGVVSGSLSDVLRTTTSTQSPFDVTQDEILVNESGAVDFVFRDIVPAAATSVFLTIYRSDPQDNWNPQFTTTASVNGGSPITIDTALGMVNGFYHTPITATVLLSGSGTLDLGFAASGTNIIRINGFEAIYEIAPAPEPASIVLLGCGLLGLAQYNRKQRRRNG